MTDHIMTWRERIGASPGFTLYSATDVERAMVAEIAELRGLKLNEEQAARDTFALAWQKALSDAAVYVASHCANGDHHADTILEMRPPPLTFRGRTAGPAQICRSSEKEQACTWTEHSDEGYWTTSCGRQWVLIDGTPVENNMKHCHGCGKVIAVALQCLPMDDQPAESGPSLAPAPPESVDTLAPQSTQSEVSAAPASTASQGSMVEDVLSTLLWLYRRLPRCYGRPPFIEQPIQRLADKVGIKVDEDLAERGPAQASQTKQAGAT